MSFTYMRKPREQKHLYFEINRVFEERVKGIYSIYKDDICLYVGQSKNLASRIATHLKGKYENCDRVDVFVDIEETDELLKLEKYMIQKLKPIENVLADFTEELNVCEYEYYFLTSPYFTLINSKFNLLIDYELSVDLYGDDRCLAYIKEKILSVETHKESTSEYKTNDESL